MRNMLLEIQAKMEGAFLVGGLDASTKNVYCLKVDGLSIDLL